MGSRSAQTTVLPDLGPNYLQYITSTFWWQIPTFDLTNASAKFEVATSNDLGEDAFTRKYIISLLTLTLGQEQTRNIAQYPLHHMTYAPAKLEASMTSCLGGNAFTRNIWFLSHAALPSTSCDLCTCKVWSCYGQWLRRCITKKIHYLTLTARSRGSRSHKILPSTLDIMWPMHQQSLMLLHPMI